MPGLRRRMRWRLTADQQAQYLEIFQACSAARQRHRQPPCQWLKMVVAFFALVAVAIYLIDSNASPGGSGSSASSSIGSVIASGVSFLTGKLSAAQIAQYAAAAGFSGADLVTAVAIALAESGGDPNAYNPETAAGTPQGLGSLGLWQIYLKAHPEFAGQNLYDPQTNANAAYSVYSDAGGTFNPWSTFGSGAYTAQINAAQGAVNG